MTYFAKRTEPGLWTVGAEDSSGRWHPASDHGDQAEALQEAAYLNGAPRPEPTISARKASPNRRLVKVIMKSGAILGVEALDVTIERARITGTLLGIEITYPDGSAGEFEFIDLSEVAAVMSEEL